MQQTPTTSLSSNQPKSLQSETKLYITNLHHCFKEFPATPTSLSGLMNIKVQYTQRFYLMGDSRGVLSE